MAWKSARCIKCGVDILMPWIPDPDVGMLEAPDRGYVADCEIHGGPAWSRPAHQGRTNAEFIAAAANAIPALIEAAEALEVLLNALAMPGDRRGVLVDVPAAEARARDALKALAELEGDQP